MRIALIVLALPVALFFLLNALFPFPVERLAPKPSRMILSDRGEPLTYSLAPDQMWRFPVALDQVAEVFPACLIASEDRHFFSHPGVNPVSLFSALVDNLRAGRVVRGGSTITMQVARLVEPKRRTYRAKLVEVFRAAQLELRFSKRQILEFYLNLTPYGGNLVGVGAASRFYFGKAPGQLSLAEAALLAAIPRAPVRYHPVRRPEAARKARSAVLDALQDVGGADPAAIALARERDLPLALARVPLVAPHFCRMMAARFPNEPTVRTTVNGRIQETVRSLVRTRLGELRAMGVENAAVVVEDLATRSVAALVGSADYLDDAHHGRVDAARSPRSPGSALKPFLYALAFDRGILSPGSFLLDVPVSFGGYEPKNYDGAYRGRVSADEALIHSLNAPAVRLLAEVGPSGFLELLRAGGLTTLDRPSAHYGLSLVLGGGEVTLFDLTNLYAALALGGRFAPARLRPQDEARPAPLLSPEACALTVDILARLERPDLPAGPDRARGVPAVAWKTGTSFGHRDAWALGVSARYAVGVWTGNVDGRPVKGISGARQAAPLLFDVFRALEPDGQSLPIPRDLALGQAEVCAESRQLPGPDCRNTVRIPVIPGVTRLGPCPVHRRVLTDARTGLLVAGECLKGREVREEVVAIYPPELVAWWRAGGAPVPQGPRPDPDCPHQALVGEPPRIVSPRPDAAYRAPQGHVRSFERVGLSAHAAAGVRELAWFQDGLLVAKGAPGEALFLELAPGRHRLVVVDDQGRSDAVRYRVE
ncbi:penicillin-binding protein 1C [Fundidesulfovibrio butyratiphilus]